MRRMGILWAMALLTVVALLMAGAAVAEQTESAPRTEALAVEAATPEAIAIEAAAPELGEMDLDDPRARGTGADDGLSTDGGILWASPSAVTMLEGDTAQITVTFRSPYGYVYVYTSNVDVVGCEWGQASPDGVLTLYLHAGREGRAEVTLTNDVTPDRATIYVTVQKHRIAFFPDPGSLDLKCGQTASVWVTFTAPYGYINMSVSDGNVVECRWGDGRTGEGVYVNVLARRQGRAVITLSNDYDGASFDIPVTVTYEAGSYPKKGRRDGRQKNRALLIGEIAFSNPLVSARYDVSMMCNMLGRVRGSTNAKWSTTVAYDLDNETVKRAIYDIFRQADEDDVSLFYISTHGNNSAAGETAGQLSLIPANREVITMRELASALKAVPGRVIIILDSCGSGAGVFRTRAEENAARAAAKDAARAFDHAVIDAFADADPGWVADDTGFQSSIDLSQVSENTGELRVKNKFYVLTSCRFQEMSFCISKTSGSYFTKWLTDGVGATGRMPADSNKNGRVTLKELFKYISKVGDKRQFRAEGRTVYQHVQVYPKSSGFELFRR